MKAVISSVFHKVISFFRKTVSLFGKTGSLFRKVGSLFRKVGFLSQKVRPLSHKTGPLFHRLGFLSRKVGPLFHRLGSFFRSTFRLLGRLIEKVRALPPYQRINRALQKTWKGAVPVRYRFLPYVTSVLRVLGWAVLVIGVLASIILGVEIMNSGLMVWGTELIGAGMGVPAIVLGIIGSFLAWLLLLVTRELIYLFIHVKDNTRNTAERITEEPG